MGYRCTFVAFFCIISLQQYIHYTTQKYYWSAIFVTPSPPRQHFCLESHNSGSFCRGNLQTRHTSFLKIEETSVTKLRLIITYRVAASAKMCRAFPLQNLTFWRHETNKVDSDGLTKSFCLFQFHAKPSAHLKFLIAKESFFFEIINGKQRFCNIFSKISLVQQFYSIFDEENLKIALHTTIPLLKIHSKVSWLVLSQTDERQSPTFVQEEIFLA